MGGGGEVGGWVGAWVDGWVGAWGREVGGGGVSELKYTNNISCFAKH